MLYPSVDELQKKVPSKYTIVTVAAKRARQIQDGKRVKVANPKSYKPVGKALEELFSGEVVVTNQPQD
ncbi:MULTISPECIES: DNA-directed RNA polymerase subunit omega [Exiguobacterium]|uniref:DNA-directed RNA polymerase subunit omega n=1 Tax=Exiguobacterium antarcticum TaxID=132920 RepID=A0ABT6QYN4_9BACL|nr:MULTISPECIES: DNA-directed RNA polymerase subunit omega [Exiguobacterium]AFS70887.1 DNA-directed RNA polymerase subunit omega [Exiguobacterium antarcticum B7]MCT4779063.1 DNA-directed RNA polymerase subunit omega [Exiguobacterium soli]MDI3233799.1 DNA-directed RNA polymerase subunit omega [Exiguobacterium antarcticum]